MVSGQRQWEAKFPTRFLGFSSREELSEPEPNHNQPFVLESESIVETLQNNLKFGISIYGSRLLGRQSAEFA